MSEHSQGPGDAIDPLEGPTTPVPGSRDPDNEIVPADQAAEMASGGGQESAGDGEQPDHEPGDDGGRVTSAGSRIETTAERLAELAVALRDPATDDARAGELAQEAADLVGAAASEIDRARRAAGEGGV